MHRYAATRAIPTRKVRGSIRFALVDVLVLRRKMQTRPAGRGRPTQGETTRRVLDGLTGVTS
jgi:hypothetical protein